MSYVNITNLTRPFTANGVPADYWLLLTVMRNGELYTRKELVELTNARAFRSLDEEGLISYVCGKYAISAEGLAFFDAYAPTGALKRIPKTVNLWKATINKSDGTQAVIKFPDIKTVKAATRIMVTSDTVESVQIDPANS